MYHALDLQVFQGNTIVTNDQGTRDLIEKILAPVGDVFVLTLQRQDRFLTMTSAQLPPGDPALQHPQSLLFIPVPVRILDHIPFAGGHEMMHAHIDPDGFPGRGERFLFNFTGKTGIPLSRLPANPHRLDLPFDQAMPPHPDSPDPGELQPASIDPEAVAILLQPEAVEAVLPLEAGISGCLAGLHSPEEGLESLIQIRNDNLKNVTVKPGTPLVFLTILLHFTQLLEFPHALMLLFPGILSLRQAGVVPPPTGFEGFLQEAELSGRGKKAILERFDDHVGFTSFKPAMASAQCTCLALVAQGEGLKARGGCSILARMF